MFIIRHLFKHPLIAFILCFLIGWVVACFFIQTDPQRRTERLKNDLIIYQGNTLAPISHLPCKHEVLGNIIMEELLADEILSGEEMKEIIWQKYPDMAELLICIAQKESNFYQLALGDKDEYGVYHAFGVYQIHRWKHGLTENEVLNFEYSLDFTYNAIQKGYGWWWTTYQLCKN